MCVCTADCKSLAANKLNSGKQQLIYCALTESEVGKIIRFIGVNQLWFSTVPLVCCKTFAICCTEVWVRNVQHYLFVMHLHLYVTQYTTEYLQHLNVFTNTRASPLRIRNFRNENLVCLYVHVLVCMCTLNYFPEFAPNIP